MSRLNAPVCILFLSALVLLAFARVSPQTFVLDSYDIIENNARLEPQAPWSAAWTTDWWGEHAVGGLYRPLTLTMLRVQKQWLGFGDAPRKYAAVNMALHLTVTLLLWQLAQRWCGNRAAALAAAGLWAVHPAMVDVVPNLVGQADLWAALWVMLAMTAWQRYQVRRDWVSLVLTALFALLAPLSKESGAAVFPLLLWQHLMMGPHARAAVADAVADSTGENDGARQAQDGAAKSWRAWAPSYLTLFFVGVGWFVVRLVVLMPLGPRQVGEPDNPLIVATLAERIFTSIKLQGIYLQHALWPVSLSPDYSFDAIPLAGHVSAAVALSLLAYALIVALSFVAWRRRQNMTVFALGWFLMALLPFSNTIAMTGVILADRLLYLPLMGLALALAALLASGGERRRAWLTAATGMVVCVFGVITWRTVPQWNSDEALWAAAVKVQPRSIKAQIGHAQTLQMAGQLGEATVYAERGVELARELRRDVYQPAYLQYALVLRAQAVHANEFRAPALWQEIATVLEEAVARHAARKETEAEAKARRALEAQTGRKIVTLDPMIVQLLSEARSKLE